MDILGCLLCLFLLSLALVQAINSITNRKKSSSSKLPPGPTPYPVIGNLLELGDKPHKSLAKLAKIYGPIMSLQLGQVTAIIVSSASMAKEFLQTHDISFSNRAIPDSLYAHNHGLYSLPFIPVSTRWRIIRKICSTHIFNNKKLDENQHLRCKKLQDLLDIVQASCCAGVAVDIGQAAFRTTLNVLSNTIFSLDLVGPDSDSAQRFMDLVWNIMEEAGRPNLADYFPVLKIVDPQGVRRRMGNYFGEMLGLFRKMIDERKSLREKTTGYAGNSDVLDILLNISEDSAEEFEGSRIENLFVDLFAAGSDTTSSTVEWAMAELLRNPETLLKAHAEIRQAIPKGKLVQESDLAKLPYLQATVKETFRMHPPVPFLIPRKSESETEVCGFKVPKGAQILVNTCAIGRDPSIWENPETFKPERFLESSSEIDVKGTNFELTPFGAGRRICPGLPLGVRMVPIMVGTLIHAFDWKLEDGVGSENINMDDKFGITSRIAQPLRAVPLAI